ncbi:tyrosinase [Ceratobasidium sp. AG-Ba]|nr:tyrosinase [Ceratobasidium sp. AG-Ba]
MTHFTGIFFPWHRWFIHTFEHALKTKCGYKGNLPYWDWSKDVRKPIPASPIFNSSTSYGFGTLGSNATNWEIRDGAFGNVTRAYPTPHVVAREYNPKPFSRQVFPLAFTTPDASSTESLTPQAIRAIVDGSAGNFTDFAYKIDGVRAQGPHNSAHIMMGGDLSNPLVSPNDPLFYLHHANLDCIWARWQKRRFQNLLAFGGGLTQDLPNYDIHPVGADPPANLTSHLPTVGLSSPVKVEDVMVTLNNYLCYTCEY